MAEPAGERDGPGARAAAPFPGPGAALAALRDLTVLGAGRALAAVDASAVYYPAVGLALGAVWVATDRLAALAGGRFAASVAVVLVAAALTAARPLAALSRTAAAGLVAHTPAQRLATLDGAATLLVWVCLALILAGEVAVLYAVDRFRVIALLFAPLLGCCSMVVLAVGSRAARADGRRMKFAPAVTFREFGIASTVTFGIVFLTTEFLGLLLMLSTAAFAVGARVFFHRWLDGVTVVAMLATWEATQVLVLAVLAAW